MNKCCAHHVRSLSLFIVQAVSSPFFSVTFNRRKSSRLVSIGQTIHTFDISFSLFFRIGIANRTSGNEKQIQSKGKRGRIHVPPVRQILPIEAQSGQAFEVRVRWPETLHLLPVPGQIHPERQAEAAHA